MPASLARASMETLLLAMIRYGQLVDRRACHVRDGILLASVAAWAGTCVVAIYFA
jgi:hypothetical protein